MPVRDPEQPDRRQRSESSEISQETVRNNEDSPWAPDASSSDGRNDDPFPGTLMAR